MNSCVLLTIGRARGISAAGLPADQPIHSAGVVCNPERMIEVGATPRQCPQLLRLGFPPFFCRRLVPCLQPEIEPPFFWPCLTVHVKPLLLQGPALILPLPAALRY